MQPPFEGIQDTNPTSKMGIQWVWLENQFGKSSGKGQFATFLKKQVVKIRTMQDILEISND